MRVLVFGKTGQVARELQNYPEVTALSRSEADLSDPVACADLIRKSDADIIINAAAYTAVDKAEDEADLAAIVNGAAPTAMAKAAAEKGIPFLHISTDYVFDGSGNTPWKPDDPVAPLNEYGTSKRQGEVGVCAAGGAYGVLRTSWVFSAHGANFVKTMLRLGAERDSLNIVGDQIGGPTAARDIAVALMAMAKAFHAGNGTNGIYHFSGAPDVSWADFAREIFDQKGLTVDVTDIPTSSYPTPATRPLNSRLDCQSLQTCFAIVRPDWRTSLANVISELETEI